MKKILYVDMDDVLVDFQSGVEKLSPEIYKKYQRELEEAPGIFMLMKPMEGAVDAFRLLSEKYDTYILSTSPWENPAAAADKLEWVKQHLGVYGYKRLIITHHKHLVLGDYLIDDSDKNEADEFQGELILFGSEKFPDWTAVTEYLMAKEE